MSYHNDDNFKVPALKVRPVILTVFRWHLVFSSITDYSMIQSSTAMLMCLQCQLCQVQFLQPSASKALRKSMMHSLRIIIIVQITPSTLTRSCLVPGQLLMSCNKTSISREYIRVYESKLRIYKLSTKIAMKSIPKKT